MIGARRDVGELDGQASGAPNGSGLRSGDARGTGRAGMNHIFSGLQVLDLTNVLSGPTLTRLMVEMGAEAPWNTLRG